MKERGSAVTWILGIAVVFLTVVLVVQSAYLFWLHRQLYTLVAGTNSGLQELDTLLNTDLASGAPAPGGNDADRAPLRHGLEAGDLQGLREQAGTLLDQAFRDPVLKDLLGDLGLDAGLDAPPAKPAAPKAAVPHTSGPAFGFLETEDRYVVTVDLSGMDASQVRASVDHGVLKISGTRGGAEFSESLAFPGPVVKGSEDVSFQDGRLTVTARKLVAEARGRA